MMKCILKDWLVVLGFGLRLSDHRTLLLCQRCSSSFRVGTQQAPWDQLRRTDNAPMTQTRTAARKKAFPVLVQQYHS